MNYDEYLAHLYEVATHPETLCHFNPNHDPENGQFAKTSGGSSGGFFARLKAKRAAKKAAQEAEKKKAKEFDDDYWKATEDFDNTKEGKRLLSAVDKYDRVDYNPDKLVDADRDYCIAVGRYAAKQMIKKYGLEYAAKMMKIVDYSDAADLIKQAGEEYYDIHGM